MKSPEEIKRGLEICVRAPFNTCDGCAYDANNCPHCVESLVYDALAYIRQLEREKEFLLDRVRGLCGHCRYSDTPVSCEPCLFCLAPERDRWEWRGVEDE